jgi:glycyl-tRNA synthetase
VGIADRSCFDLTSHSEASNDNLVAYESYDEPKIKQVVKVTPDKKAIGPALKGDAKAVYDYLESISEEKALALKNQLEAEG